MRAAGGRLLVAAFAALLVLSSSGPSAGALGDTTARVDLTASAHPRVPVIPDVDLTFHVDSVDGQAVHAVTTATSSAPCRRCLGAAISVQVLYVDRAPSGELDNAAVAWTQGCTGCRAVAVSLQVVVIRRASTLLPTNRALAVTAKCTRCRARSEAYQLVVGGSAQATLTADQLQTLENWAAERGRQLLVDPAAGRSPQQARAVPARSLGTIAHRVNAALGTTTVAARTRVVTG